MRINHHRGTLACLAMPASGTRANTLDACGLSFGSGGTPPTVAAGLRLSGNDALYPSDPVRLTMVRDGKDQVRGTFKLCVSRGGRVDDIQLIQSTGYAAYDGELTRAMQAWTFRPYLVNGAPAPMCTVKVVLFRLKR